MKFEIFCEIFRKKNKKLKKVSKLLLTRAEISAIIMCVENIGASPSGKATDSDSVIS